MGYRVEDIGVKGHCSMARAIAAIATMMFCAAPSSAAQEAQTLFENSDFSRGDFLNWESKGEAFGEGPARDVTRPDGDVTGSAGKDLNLRWDNHPEVYCQPAFSGWVGYFANSYHPLKLDKAQDELISTPFLVRNPFISFLLGGGEFSLPGRLSVNLLVGDEVVRQANPRGLNLEPVCFDVRSLRGETARLQLVDEHPFYGGWIVADEFSARDQAECDWVVSDADSAFISKSISRRLKATQRFLNVPAQKAFPGHTLKIAVDGKVVEERCMAIASEDDAEFWQYVDLSLWQGREVEVRFAGYTDIEEPLADAFLSNSIKGLDSVYAEGRRPQFHYTPRQGWSNDVNGAVYYDGEYHLFYQYDPSQSGLIGRNMHWGHAVSKDLFHWEELPIALGTDPVRGQVYSGSAIVDEYNVAGLQQGKEKTMIAFYSRRYPYTTLKHDFGVAGTSQCMAYSTDRGRTWTHVEEPVVPMLTTKNRDPKVFWHEETRQWIMVFFKVSGFVFYGSTDLFHWKELSEIDGYHECPDFFQLAIDGDATRTKWVLVNGSGEYSLGHFDGKFFTLQYRGRSDFGPISATQTFGQAPGGIAYRTQLAWLRVSSPDMPFRQMISLPMDLTLRSTPDGPRIFSNPAASMVNLHGQTIALKPEQLAGGQVSNERVPWELVDATFSIELNGAPEVAFEIRGILVSYDTQSGVLNIGPISKRKNKRSATLRPVAGRLSIRAILDRSTLDLIVNGGQAHLVGEARPDATEPFLRLAQGRQKARVAGAAFTEMKSAWRRD